MTEGAGSTEAKGELSPGDHALVMTKNRVNRLGFAILLVFFRDHGRFPKDESEIDQPRIAALSQQLNVPVLVDGAARGGAFLEGRTAERARAEIRTRFGFREATVADAELLTEWLSDHVADEVGGEMAPMVERLQAHCCELAIEPPTANRVARIVRAALRAYEERFHADIYEGSVANFAES